VDIFPFSDLRFNGIDLFQGVLGRFVVVPEIVSNRIRFQLLEFPTEMLKVKDAPLAFPDALSGVAVRRVSVQTL